MPNQSLAIDSFNVLQRTPGLRVCVCLHVCLCARDKEDLEAALLSVSYYTERSHQTAARAEIWRRCLSVGPDRY